MYLGWFRDNLDLSSKGCLVGELALAGGSASTSCSDFNRLNEAFFLEEDLGFCEMGSFHRAS